MAENNTACIEQIRCLQISPGGTALQEVTVIHEAPVDISINGRVLVRTQCMLRDVAQMAVGFMLCEGVIQHRSEIRDIVVDHAAGRADMIADVPFQRLERERVSTRIAAGGGRMAVIDIVKDSLKASEGLMSTLTIDAKSVLRIGNAFNEFKGLYHDSRFVHSAALSDGVHILYHCEDVGRHNAVDKVLGYGFQNEENFGSLMLLCSGRFSLEMVSKAACVGIPLYVSPAAPSFEAVQLAEQIGMTLCGRVAPGGASVYSNAWRVTRS